jgi:F-type H+-transporting ATPase subunit delta
MPSAVSFRYAIALADSLSGSATDPQAIASQLKEFDTFLNESHELRIVFSTPAVSPEKKKAILADLAQTTRLDAVTRSFLKVVIDHDRMPLLGEIAEAFEALLNERLGIAVAEVTAARQLDEDEKHELAEALAAKTGKKVRMNFSLDPSLIGGLVARVGSTIYDGSVRGQLGRLRAKLVGE